jgi:hypothetical protein
MHAYNACVMGQRKHTRRATAANFPVGAVAGVLATITMDVAMASAAFLAPDTFASDKIDLAMIGRWAGGLAHGRWRHDDIAAEPPMRGELCAGFATHYLTGVVLTRLYVAALRRGGLKPDPLKAAAFGLATSVLPLLVLYPSMGYGCCGRRADDSRRLLRVMLLGHFAFGAGIGLGTALTRGGAAAE